MSRLALLLSLSVAAVAQADAYDDLVALRAQIRKTRAECVSLAAKKSPTLAQKRSALVGLMQRREKAIASATVHLIEQLDGETPKIRTRAMQRLRGLMPDALPMLLEYRSHATLGKQIRELIGGADLGPDGLLRQWASSASASSQYTATSWSATQATGRPNTPDPGDRSTAWATLAANGGHQTLTLTYPLPIHPTRIRIHENFNPGAVIRVDAIDEDGEPQALWSGKLPTDKPMRVLDLTLTPSTRRVRRIRLTLDTDLVAGWNEIDAVQLLGKLRLSVKDHALALEARRLMLELRIRERQQALAAQRKLIEKMRGEAERLKQERAIWPK